MKTTGEIIREARRKNGMSQEALARAAGVSTLTVTRAEIKNTKLREDTLRKISVVLGINLTGEKSTGNQFNDYQRMLIVRAIRTRIRQAIEQEAVCLANGMEVDKSEVLRVWEEHKDD